MVWLLTVWLKTAKFDNDDILYVKLHVTRLGRKVV